MQQLACSPVAPQDSRSCRLTLTIDFPEIPTDPRPRRNQAVSHTAKAKATKAFCPSIIILGTTISPATPDFQAVQLAP
jgi:hypothetical protein